MKSVLVLGAGFAGLELATVLSAEVPDEVEVTIVDSSDAFVFGYSKLDLLFGRKDLAAVRVPYAHLDKPSVRFVQETILGIDPESRRVTTSASHLRARHSRRRARGGPGPGGHTGHGRGRLRVLQRRRRRPGARHALPAFVGGDVIIGVLGNFFKCPAAPFEAAFMLHDYLEKHGVRSRSTIKIVSPMGTPIPISPEASAGILEAAAERSIDWVP